MDNTDTAGVKPLCIIIDGRSGAGKTTLALHWVEQLAQLGPAECTPVELVQCEYLYEGWSGLAKAAIILARDVFSPAHSYHPWDWYADQWSDQLCTINPQSHLVVEGCGSITAEVIAAAENYYEVMTVDLHVPADIRKQRALARSPEMAPFWDMWAAQEDIHRSGMPDVQWTIGSPRPPRLRQSARP